MLSGESPQYLINSAAFDYMCKRKLSKNNIKLLQNHPIKRFDSEKSLHCALDDLGILQRKVNSRPVRIITEGALWGALLEDGNFSETVILSDDAKQFRLGCNALCSVHAERHFKELPSPGDDNRQTVDARQSEIWNLYRQLGEYRLKPDAKLRESLLERFDQIFNDKTGYHSLNLLLERQRANKPDLLRVLDHPHTPLHNNLGEIDLRVSVMRRKISSGTCSDKGRDGRDAGLGILKTCQIQQLRFWHLLRNRFKVPDAPDVPDLPALVSQLEKSTAPT